MARQQSAPNSLSELAQIRSGIQRSEARRSRKWAVADAADGMTAAAQPLGNDVAALLRRLRVTRPRQLTCKESRSYEGDDTRILHRLHRLVRHQCRNGHGRQNAPRCAAENKLAQA